MTYTEMVRRFGMLAVLTVLGGLSVAACNTIEGAGEDIESVGEEIEDDAS
ncbi:entericidin A/B family lipoprotein [Iodidimonas muriae]|nr:entericidin A/B family lipoprotein [Iodidimonas muriae]